ncbi:MAG: GNAT family N-acetyltransferase [Leptospirillia bacterium]
MGPESLPGRENREELLIVEAQVREAPALALLWEKLMLEESPPHFHVGIDGVSKAESAFRRMLTQPGSYRGYLLVPDSLAPMGGNPAPAGFILGSVYERLYGRPSRAGNIMHWYVKPEVRGEGQGERLYQALLEWFREANVETVEVMARTEAPRLSAWRRRGFSEVLSLLVMPAPWRPE